MGDHFVLLVDRLLTHSTLEAALQRNNQSQSVLTSSNKDLMSNCTSQKMDNDLGGTSNKLAECRICHDEDKTSNMDTPCSCRGSLKYAHRRCVQRWCNEKGDILCEICLQQFKPGYMAPPPHFHCGGTPMSFRGNLEDFRSQLHNPQYRVISADGNVLDSDADEFSLSTPRSLICCRVVVIIFMILLLLRHMLPILVTDVGEYTVTLLMLIILRSLGIILPIYVMAKAVIAMQRRRQPQVSHSSSFAALDQDSELLQQLPRPHVIHIQ